MNAGSIIATLRLNTDEFRQGITSAQSAIRDTSAAFKAVGTASVAAGTVIAAGIGAAVKVAATFESSMSRVGAVAGASKEEMAALTAEAMKLGAETSFSSKAAAEGMQYLAMAGFKTKDIIAAMPGVLSMAASGQVELGEAANVAANTLSGFNLKAGDAGKVADVLTKTFTSSNTTLGSLGETMKYAAPIAANVGWSLESMAAAAGKLGNAAIAGSDAGTALRTAITSLAAPTDAGAKVLEKYNIKVTDAKGKLLPFADILQQMNTKFANLSDSQRTAAVQTIFGTEAMSAMLVLMKDPKGLKEFETQLKNAGGTADKVASDQLDNLDGAVEALGGSFETAQIVIGNQFIPVIRGISEVLTGVLNWFTALNPQTQQFIAYSLAITAAVLLVLGGLALMVGFAPQILAFFGNVTTVVGALGKALTFLTMNPIGILIMAIAALVAIFIYLWNTNEAFRTKVIEIWNAIVAYVTPAINAIVTVLRTQFDALVVWWNAIMPQFLQAATNAWNMIWAVLKPIIDLIVAIIVWAFPYILAIVMQVWENIKGVIEGALGVIKGIIEVFTYLFTGQWSKLWESVKNLVASGFQMIWNLFQLWALGKIVKVVIAMGSAIFGAIGSMISSVMSSVGGFVANILGRFSGLSSSVIGIFNGIKSFIISVFTGLPGAVMGALTGLINGISAKVQQARKILADLNPFQRHSPSLVDNVLAGVKVIKDTYAEVGEMQIKPPAIGSITPGRIDVAGIVSGSVASANAGSNGGTNYNAPLVQVDKMEVRSDEDIRNVSNELYNLQRNAERSRGR